jgi:hypothetical protein
MQSHVQMKQETLAQPKQVTCHHSTDSVNQTKDPPTDINTTLDALSMSFTKTSKMGRKQRNGLTEPE